MKRFVIAIALCGGLSSSAFAGQIPSVPVAPPPPEEETQTTSTTAPGNIPTVGYAEQMSVAGLDFIQLIVGAIV
jgi:hypothetical protein